MNARKRTLISANGIGPNSASTAKVRTLVETLRTKMPVGQGCNMHTGVVSGQENCRAQRSLIVGTYTAHLMHFRAHSSNCIDYLRALCGSPIFFLMQQSIHRQQQGHVSENTAVRKTAFYKTKVLQKIGGYGNGGCC
jgi:hypothetical protein